MAALLLSFEPRRNSPPIIFAHRLQSSRLSLHFCIGNDSASREQPGTRRRFELWPALFAVTSRVDYSRFITHEADFKAAHPDTSENDPAL